MERVSLIRKNSNGNNFPHKEKYDSFPFPIKVKNTKFTG